MILLLDTHTFLWWLAGDEALSRKSREGIETEAEAVFVSAASVWEIGIKREIGKLSFVQRIVEAILAHRFSLLPITGEHAEHAAELPRHHADPFDRLLVAQALLERLLLGTQDLKIKPYQVHTLGLGEK